MPFQSPSLRLQVGWPGPLTPPPVVNADSQAHVPRLPRDPMWEDAGIVMQPQGPPSPPQQVFGRGRCLRQDQRPVGHRQGRRADPAHPLRRRPSCERVGRSLTGRCADPPVARPATGIAQGVSHADHEAWAYERATCHEAPMQCWRHGRCARMGGHAAATEASSSTLRGRRDHA